MREIKFRVWDDQRKVFRNDINSFRTEEGKIIGVSYDNDEEHFIKKQNFISYPSSQIQEFTGLKDKEGNEIYEGDIVRIKFDHQGLKPDEFEIDTVGIHPIYGTCTIKNLYRVDETSEIIGNIHENPELLNEQK